MKKILFAMMAAVCALCLSSCEEPQQDVADVVIKVAVHPDMLRYYDVTFCYDDPSGQPVKMPLTQDILQPIDTMTKLYREVREMLVESNCDQPESYLSQVRYFSISARNVSEWRHKGLLVAEKKADAPSAGRLRFVCYVLPELMTQSKKLGYFFSGCREWKMWVYSDAGADELKMYLDNRAIYDFALSQNARPLFF